MVKKIVNIVFYKLNDEKGTEKLACIFYSDGTVDNVSFEEGIDACEVLVKERGIKSKDAFQEMINNELVHVMSGKELSDRFESFIPAMPVREAVVEQPDELASSAQEIQEEFQGMVDRLNSSERESEAEVVEAAAPVVTEEGSDPATAEDQRLEEVFQAAAAAVARDTASIPERVNGTDPVEEAEAEEVAEGVDPFAAADSPAEAEEKEDSFITGTGEVDPFEHDDDDEKAKADDSSATAVDEDIEDDDIIEDSSSKKKGIFSRAFDWIKKNRLAKRVVAVVTALGLSSVLYGCGAKQTLEGEMNNSNLTAMTYTDDGVYTEDGILFAGDNSFYNNYSFANLVQVTESEVQKNAMVNLEAALRGFNEKFASHYIEYGVNVKASLKFEEMIALQMAYNDFSKQDIQAIFNGADIRSDELVRFYKDASLQLMGAYAMENSKHPLDMSMLLETEEGRAFYNKYHEAFLAAKEATGEDQINKVKDFYAMVRKDFPITNEVRTEGISHSENYDMIEPYKLSVTPMIAAAEMLWQNLRVDNTLQDGEIDFLNDLGLCNYAEGTFDRIELITLTSEEDKTNPTYDQYRNAIISMLTKEGLYYIDDDHRELTRLAAFQEAVNGHFYENTDTSYKGTGSKGGSTSTSTRQETKTRTETTTTTTVEETRTEKTIPDSVRAQIDDQIAAENEEAKRAGEAAAELERQRLQALADEEARLIQEQIRREEEDFQRRIDALNDIINNGGTVNESDFGNHGVHFDPNHQDGNGNLNDSVQNVTTDPTGDMTNEPLPDPNVTGQAFDAQSAGISYQRDSDVTLPQTGQSQSQGIPSSADSALDNNGNEYQFWVEEGEYSDGEGWSEVSDVVIDPEYEGYFTMSAQNNQQLVNDYVEGLANENGGEQYGEGYQYTK